MRLKRTLLALAVTSLASSGAWATNGYFSHGFGQKSQGMGGTGIAFPQDSLAAATNPAGMAFVGNRMDLGASLFRPQREATSAAGTTFDGNAKDLFLIPEFGYNRMINDRMSFGVSVFGNGGMNTSYKTNPGFGTGSAGVNLMQLFITPTLAWKLNEGNSIGVGLNLAAQRFSAKGLDGFAGLSTDAANLTNRGNDYSYGAGLRLGWTGKVSDRITLGATYQSRTYMSEFDKYRGLFAEQGDFDIPENFGIGIAVQATPQLAVAFDVMRINYSKIASIGNNNGTGVLGSDTGSGFGWEDQTVYKLGLSYDYSNDLTLRAGLNYGKSPVTADQTSFNVLAPGVVETHLTLGATWKMAQGQELTVSYTHAFENKVTGSKVPPLGPTSPDAYDLRMYQDAIGVAYSWAL